MPNNDSLFENIYSAFLSAIEKYRLVEAGDRVAVCISGGKDSMLASLFFKRYANVTVRYICMDPGYNA